LTTYIGHFVGADLSRTSPIHRPEKPIREPLADKSAVRQSIVRLRDITVLVVKIHYRPLHQAE
jgi:hypothetical protein